MTVPNVSKLVGSFQQAGPAVQAGFAVWNWSEARSQWSLVENRSQPGYHPGTGPTQAGRFEGHTVRWASVPVHS